MHGDSLIPCECKGCSFRRERKAEYRRHMAFGILLGVLVFTVPTLLALVFG